VTAARDGRAVGRPQHLGPGETRDPHLKPDFLDELAESSEVEEE
jgi:hypothetical protein